MQNTQNNTNLKDAKSINQLRTQEEWTAHKVNDGWVIKEKGFFEKGFSDRIAELNDYPDHTQEYNAQYICLAVNNFEPVLEALKNCREWYDKHGKDYEIGLPNCFIKAKQAINKATL